MSSENAVQDDFAAYSDPTQVEGNGEPFDTESDNASVWVPTLPGNYINQSRIAVPKDGKVVRLQKDGRLGFYLKLTGGVTDPRTGVTSDTRFPFGIYISTTMTEQKEWVNGVGVAKLGFDGKPILRSSAAQYLKLFGMQTKGLTQERFEQLILETLEQPVGVRIDWREKQPKNPETGQYDKGYKFKTYSKTYRKAGEDGIERYFPEVVVDGVLYKASAYAKEFRSIPTE